MNDRVYLRTTITVACVLFFGTLYIFYRLNSTGPVATIKLFHLALQDHDQKLRDRVIDSVADPAAPRLEALVSSLLNQGAQYQIVRSQGETDKVVLQVVYKVGNRSAPMFFVLNREGHDWRIDATKSLQTLERAIGMPLH